MQALLTALGSFVLVAGTIVLLLLLHLDGTLRAFLDRQSMGGMILVVLAVNAIGFTFVYMAMAAWKTVRRDLFGRSDD